MDMFQLPSIPNMIISTIVFMVAAWFCRRYLDESGIPPGLTRGLLIFIVASFPSWAAGEGVDWLDGKLFPPVVLVVSQPSPSITSPTLEQKSTSGE